MLGNTMSSPLLGEVSVGAMVPLFLIAGCLYFCCQGDCKDNGSSRSSGGSSSDVEMGRRNRGSSYDNRQDNDDDSVSAAVPYPSSYIGFGSRASGQKENTCIIS